jgi:hypothetical protein
MQTVITIDDTLTPGGAAIRVEPELDILEKAAKTSATPLAPSQVYALGVLNALRDFSKDPNSVVLPKMRGPRSGLVSVSKPVGSVVIKLYDRVDGGVCADSNPSFSTLAQMVAGGSTISEVHKYALVALGRIFQMSRESKSQR